MYAELIHWNELDYQDDNSNLFYGVEILDENEFSMDCYWFESDKKRQEFIQENNFIIKK